ncbi:coatomer subunit beta-1-like [Pyrus ussuriensis x Pyrus communis]|uniref:Coatomer subunit beta-1-like n=1 Tax=Pyrus ussuriensis x Pyrus communis TaxID=2448454 RepID=A0A5N5EYX7_9ROSA|nr:coatomer subunit beta-1-like [Pyrus ussuriensis x Pyrus communis]
MLLLNGNTIPYLFITIICYVLFSEDHTVQKLILLYLVIIDKTDSKGKVMPEMILICQNLRNNLRFLCRLNEFEIIKLTATPFVRQMIMSVPVATGGYIAGQRAGR